MTHDIYIEDVCTNQTLGEEAATLITNVIYKTLEYENVKYPCNVSVAIVDEDEIREINSEHRGIDKVTDVLSFPVVNLLDGSFDEDAGDFFEGYLILGDVILCSKRAKVQSEEFGHSYERELGYLTCHSILHLIGYDHEAEDEREVMRQKEESVMQLMALER